ncbi:MAG: rhamnan synthesis F family protein [Planctomycetia bacterium]|jgi:lipopolysaccharide biosynthesis protein
MPSAAAQPPSVPPRRAVVYAHFDPQGRFDPHVERALARWRTVADRLVLVSAGGGPLPATVSGLVDRCILRANDGYDFCSWKAGLETLEAGLHDEVVCVNDSVYGPLTDPAALFADPRVTEADLWGMVLSEQPPTGRGTRRPHLQSWFFAMRRPFLESATCAEFWRQVVPLPDKAEIIERYEIGISERALAAGFRVAALYDARHAGRLSIGEILPHLSLASPRRAWRLVKKCRRATHNPSELVWWRLLAAGVPFVKVGLFRVNHYGLALRRLEEELLRRHPDHWHLIRGHLARCG